jgi:uncharacterized protein
MASKNASTDKPQGPLAEFTSRPIFQLSIPAPEPARVRDFYQDLLGSRLVRETPEVLEFSFFGGMLCVYRVERMPETLQGERNGRAMPVPTFGLLMSWEDWHRAVDHLNYVGIEYTTPPGRSMTTDGREEMWFVITDPAGNHLGFGTARGAG